MKRISPRFSLGSLLLLIVIVAMGIAWRLDHSRLKHEFINSQTRIAASELLANDPEQRMRTSEGYGFSEQWHPTNQFAAPHAFIDALRTTVDWYKFQESMEAFVRNTIADDTVPSLINVLNDADPEVRWRALATLGRMARQKRTVVPAITPLLRDKHRNVRWHAAYALGQFGPKALVALPALRQIIDNESSAISAFAVGMAFKIDSSIEFEPRLQVFLRSSDPDTRQRAVEALGGIISERSVAKATEDALLEAFRASGDETTKRSIATLLERIKDGPAAAQSQAHVSIVREVIEDRSELSEAPLWKATVRAEGADPDY